jgi:hypothetical protein
MMSALISFLGGSVFRMIWGELSAFFSKKQEHEHELELMQAQSVVDDRVHQRTLENLRLQSELGVRMVEVQRDTAIAQGDADAFTAAMKHAFKPTGNKFIDAWNGGIRPMYASIAAVLWILKLYTQGFKMDEFDVALVAVIVGFFFADRSLRRNGK